MDGRPDGALAVQCVREAVEALGFAATPPLCPVPPRVHPPPVVGGNRHFVNHPKHARCNIRVLCVPPVPSLPSRCTYCDQTFSVAYVLMDLDSTTVFPFGTDVNFIRSTKAPALTRVIGYSERREKFCRITCWQGKKPEVQHDTAPVERLSLARVHVGGELYCTRDIPEEKWNPKDFLAPISAKPPAKKAKPPLKGAPQNIPTQSVKDV